MLFCFPKSDSCIPRSIEFTSESFCWADPQLFVHVRTVAVAAVCRPARIVRRRDAVCRLPAVVAAEPVSKSHWF